MSMITDLLLTPGICDWEEHAREYLANLKIRLLELKAAPHFVEEQLEQFKLKRKIINTLVEKIYFHKDRSLEVTIRLYLLEVIRQ